MIRPLCIAVLATILITVWLTAQNRGGVNLLAACGPEIVKNGSFEASNFTATGFLFLNDANNCVKKDDPCLDAWNVGLPANKLAWVQTPAGVTGVPADPVNSAADKRFINLSGQTNGSRNTGFPPLSQAIHLEPGFYELRFKLGQGSSPQFGRTSPVSIDVAIAGAKTGGLPPTVTSAPNGGAWQDFIFRFSSNGGDFHLTFSAHPHPDNVMGFVGLDNVSMKALSPQASRACL